MQDPSDILEKYWNYPSFRGSQSQVIRNVMHAKDALALMPTGGGKSICYQVPALCMDGICVVVSPLVALMEDQVNALKKKNIKALSLTGGISTEELVNRLDNCMFGNYKFLYLSPERLQQDLVRERLQQMDVNLLAIDEAHCISQWGNDFRPAYLACADLRELCPGIPVLALTATATRRVEKDIIERLLLQDPKVFRDSFSRANIAYRVRHEEDKRYRLKRLCRETGGSVITYVRTRREAEYLARHLEENEIRATFYHGGLDKEDKRKRMKRWMEDQVQVMVATSAFGMGIDKADVRLVVHYQLPDSVESYFQEAGRAGRDGKEALAVLLLHPADADELKQQFLGQQADVTFIKDLYNKLNNYFQISYGEGQQTTHHFHFNAFCERYKLPAQKTYNGLQVLDRHSVISFSPQFQVKTTVRFVAGKQQLMEYLQRNMAQASRIQTILRTYGGIFEYPTLVNPYLLAKKTQSSEKEIFTLLRQLEADGIIELEASEGDLKLTFLLPREDDHTINPFAKDVKEQQQLKAEKITALIRYAEEDRICRSKQLLAYFGEKQADPCGKCDVCLGRQPEIPEQKEVLEARMLELLREGPLRGRDLSEQLKARDEEVIALLRKLLDESRIAITKTNRYRLIQ